MDTRDKWHAAELAAARVQTINESKNTGIRLQPEVSLQIK